MKFRVLFKVSATLLLAAAILFCAVAAQAEQTEAEPVTGEFDREIYVFEAGKDVYMLVDLKNTKGLQASAAAELRLDDGVVLAKADIKAGDKRVKFIGNALDFVMPFCRSFFDKLVIHLACFKIFICIDRIVFI